ncbi:MAG: hydroxylamine reductase [Planctomycetota bacterium]
MFCYQCEQTAQGKGCTARGVCGKDAETATLQDLLVHVTKGIGMYAHRARKLGAKASEIDVFVVQALFSTITNVDFDPERLRGLIVRAAELRDRARAMYEEAARKAGVQPEKLDGAAALALAKDLGGLVEQGRAVSITKRKEKYGEDITGLQELATYGLKGAAAYADHAQILGKEADGVYASFHEMLDFLAKESKDTGELLAAALRVGELNLRAMEILDQANTGAHGDPAPTQVRVEPLKGKAIAVSGHDLADLEEILKQTEGKGINVYTHGEMLPAHGYPGLKKYKHLAGNYGSAWQNQQKEFSAFPGAILMTTNCIQRPNKSYEGRIFTSGLVAWPGVRHISNRDFSPVVEAAIAAEGFPQNGPDREITVGFGHKAVLGVAGQVIEAVKSGKLKHFFLIGGCDGARPGRNYYTELADLVPKDCAILTLACGKYRFNKKDFGKVAGLPRLLDIGQCNDAYSAIVIAKALADAFGVGVNDLPLTLVLSWYEQKACAILLTLLHLGIRNIRLGPTLPAFVTPAALQVLAEKFAIKPIGTPKGDLEAILGGKS